MKILSYITALLVMVGSTCFGQGMRISAYPNTNNLGFSNLFIVAIKGSPGTNMNISWQQLSNLFHGATLIQVNSSSNASYNISSNIAVALVDTKSNFVVSTHGNLQVTNKVGIGTNTPQALIDIQGTNTGNGYLLRVGSLNIANGTNVFTVSTNGNAQIQLPDSVGRLTIRGNTADYTAAELVLQSDGNGGGSRGQVVYFYDVLADKEWFAGTPYADTDAFAIGRFVSPGAHASSIAQKANSLFIIEDTGNTGIGTNAPAATLHVAGNNNQNVFQAGTTNMPTLVVTDTNGVTRIEGGTFYPTNTVPSTVTAAFLGIGGHWVGNSNGFLVDIYSLDGATTVMKVLSP